MGFISSFHHHLGYIYIFLEPFFESIRQANPRICFGPVLLITVPESLIIFFCMLPLEINCYRERGRPTIDRYIYTQYVGVRNSPPGWFENIAFLSLSL